MSDPWPVGGTTTLQFNSPFIDSAGNGGQTFSPDPGGMAMFGQNVYIPSSSARTIRRYNIDGTGMTQITNPDFSNESESFRGIAGYNGKLYVADAGPALPNDPTGEIRRYNLDGSTDGMFYEKSSPRGNPPFGVVGKSPGRVRWFNDRLYIQEGGTGSPSRIGVFDAAGNKLGNLDPGPGTAGLFTIRADGTLFALDHTGDAATRVVSISIGTANDLSDYGAPVTFGEANGVDTPAMISVRDVGIDPRNGSLIALTGVFNTGQNNILQFTGDTGDFVQTIASWTVGPDTGARELLVTPEPATLALVGLGSLLMIRRRRGA